MFEKNIKYEGFVPLDFSVLWFEFLHAQFWFINILTYLLFAY